MVDTKERKSQLHTYIVSAWSAHCGRIKMSAEAPKRTLKNEIGSPCEKVVLRHGQFQRCDEVARNREPHGRYYICDNCHLLEREKRTAQRRARNKKKRLATVASEKQHSTPSPHLHFLSSIAGTLARVNEGHRNSRSLPSISHRPPTPPPLPAVTMPIPMARVDEGHRKSRSLPSISRRPPAPPPLPAATMPVTNARVDEDQWKSGPSPSILRRPLAPPPLPAATMPVTNARVDEDQWKSGPSPSISRRPPAPPPFRASTMPFRNAAQQEAFSTPFSMWPRMRVTNEGQRVYRSSYAFSGAPTPAAFAMQAPHSQSLNAARMPKMSDGQRKSSYLRPPHASTGTTSSFQASLQESCSSSSSSSSIQRPKKRRVREPYLEDKYCKSATSGNVLPCRVLEYLEDNKVRVRYNGYRTDTTVPREWLADSLHSGLPVKRKQRVDYRPLLKPPDPVDPKTARVDTCPQRPPPGVQILPKIYANKPCCVCLNEMDLSDGGNIVHYKKCGHCIHTSCQKEMGILNSELLRFCPECREPTTKKGTRKR